MGCDIHIVVERCRKATDKWIGVYATDELPGRRIPIAQRDYAFFAAVAGVRGEGDNYPQNVPEDISALAWQQYMRAPTDHHSASHLSAYDFCATYLKVNPAAARTSCAMAELLGVVDDDEYHYRVVFWFDN